MHLREFFSFTASCILDRKRDRKILEINVLTFETIYFSTVPELPCYDALGMEDYNISDSKITASSSQGGYIPQDARLHVGSAWVSYHTEFQWIQVRFLRQALITGVITQGAQGEDTFVKTYKVRYSMDNQPEDWKYILDENEKEEASSM